MQIDDRATKHLTSAHIKRDILRIKVSRSLSRRRHNQLRPAWRYMCGKIDRKTRDFGCVIDDDEGTKRFAKFLEASWRAITAMAIINCFDSLRSPIWIHLSNCTQRHLIALHLFTSIRFLRIFNIFFSLFSIIFFFTSFFFSFTFFTAGKFGFSHVSRHSSDDFSVDTTCQCSWTTRADTYKLQSTIWDYYWITKIRSHKLQSFVIFSYIYKCSPWAEI